MSGAGWPPARPAWYLRTLWGAYSVLVIYASLAPFGPWEPWQALSWRFLLAPLPRHVTTFDVLINVLAYLPLGWLGTVAWRQRWPRHAILLAVLGAGLLSFTMESLQGLLAPRIPSNVDLLTNTLGAACGAAPWLMPRACERMLAPLERWRERTLLPGPGAEMGCLLLMLWCACHLDPAIPFLGAGVLRNPYALQWFEQAADPADWGLQTAAAALSTAGLGLFMACLVKQRRVAHTLTLLMLLLVMAAKATLADFLLKPALATEWFGSATLAGLALGAFLLLGCLGLVGARRALVAGVCLLAGGTLAKLGSHYVPLAAMRALFGWNFGQLRSFTGLTVWLNEIWPLLTVLFLVVWSPRAPQVSSSP